MYAPIKDKYTVQLCMNFNKQSEVSENWVYCLGEVILFIGGMPTQAPTHTYAHMYTQAYYIHTTTGHADYK